MVKQSFLLQQQSRSDNAQLEVEIARSYNSKPDQ